jgi:hypothetical protein
MKFLTTTSILMSILGITEAVRIALRPATATVENYTLLVFAIIVLCICASSYWRQDRDKKKEAERKPLDPGM